MLQGSFQTTGTIKFCGTSGINLHFGEHIKQNRFDHVSVITSLKYVRSRLEFGYNEHPVTNIFVQLIEVGFVKYG